MSEPTVTKVFVTDRAASRITLDPYMETADVDMSNNHWPPRPEPTRFEVFQGSPYSRYYSGGGRTRCSARVATQSFKTPKNDLTTGDASVS